MAASCSDCAGILGKAENLKVLQAGEVLSYCREVSALRTTAAEGCILCQILLGRHELVGPKTAEDIECEDPGNCTFTTDILTDIETRIPFFITKVERGQPKELDLPLIKFEGVRQEHKAGVLHAEPFSAAVKHSWYIVFELEAKHDDPAAAFITRRPVNGDVESDDSFHLARTWLDQCIKSHTMCPKPEGAVLPTRVIDVGTGDSDGRPRIVHPEGERGNYVALSYCWGGQQNVRITRATLGQYEDGMATESLPRTIRDAITVTQRLRIQYVWVDALCILQDDVEDREREIGKMSSIYKNALVTISAARATHCDEGFLRPGEPSTLPIKIFDVSAGLYNSIKLPISCPDGRVGRVSIRERFDAPNAEDPLNERGWALQESLLSPRRLIYSRAQLFWKCWTRFAKDGGHSSWENYRNVNGLKMAPIGLEDENLTLEDSESEEHWNGLPPQRRHSMELYRRWFLIVNDYTRRELTLSEDKLPALAGMASEFSRLTGDRYLGGLWENHLLTCLSWSRVNFTAAPAPSKYRAPSWSWASIDDPITYQLQYCLGFKVHVATVIRCFAFPQSELAPMAGVKGGYLDLECPMRPVIATYVSQERSAPFDVVRFMLAQPSDEGVRAYDWKADTAPPRPELVGREAKMGVRAEALVLAVTISRSQGDREWLAEVHGMIVCRKGNGTAYQRLGWFDADAEGWCKVYEDGQILWVPQCEIRLVRLV